MEIHRQIITAMVAHSVAALPHEACGLLAADSGGTLRMAYCLTNTRHSRSRFALDPTEHYRTIRHADSMGWSIAGVFHSHPSSDAVPSRIDLAADLDAEWLNVIVSLASRSTPEVRAYWIRRGGFVEEPIEVTGAASVSRSSLAGEGGV